MKEMFEASVDGKPYDNERWGNYFRPYGLEAPAGGKPADDAETPTPIATPKVSIPDDEPAMAESVSIPTAASSDKAQDILAMIRARQAKTA